MNNLPIFANGTPSTTKAPLTKTANNNANDESQVKPFGEMLAKQLGGKQDDSAKLETLKKPASTKLETRGTDIAAAPAVDAPPQTADLLASLLPQTKRAPSVTEPVVDPAAATATAEPAAPIALATAVGLNDSADSATVTADAKNDRKTAFATTGAEKQAAANAHEPADIKHKAKERISTNPDFVAGLKAQDAHRAEGKLSNLPAKGEIQILGTQAGNSVSLSQPLTALATPATSNAPVQASIATPINQPQWREDFGQKITWMATQRNQSAELHLNPAQLGPLEVSLKLNGDQATLQFTSAHAAVRDAIEQSIPRLRDMLADSGISLGNTTVSDQASREQQQRGQTAAARGSADNEVAPDLEPPPTHTLPVRRHDGVVDTFA